MRTKALTLALFGGLLAAAAANAQQPVAANTTPDATPPNPEQRATTEPSAPITANTASESKPADQMKLARIAKFNTLDTNKDGYLSKPEVSGDKSVTDNFAKYDLNGDSKISRSEFENTQF